MNKEILYKLIISSLALCVLVFSGIAGISIAEEAGSENDTKLSVVENISTEKGYELISNNTKNPDFRILDVRTPGEFAGGHISNATNIDYQSSTFKDNLKQLDRDKTFIVYCRSGNRSSKAVKIMNELGFKSVYNMGGIIDWENRGYPVVK